MRLLNCPAAAQQLAGASDVLSSVVCERVAFLLVLLPCLSLSRRRICNRKIISHVQQIICFAFHDSRLLMETCHEAKDSKKIVTLFFLD